MKPRMTQEKRRKELARQERQRDKMARRAEKKAATREGSSDTELDESFELPQPTPTAI
jgi:hypothetical protein